ncbi:MAG: NAD(P)H-hydrate dehydratase [Actinobacteria bacterium]|nr:NAD(P)H-hydrate dehydratase [Actinomycetota bacterium]
MLPIVTPNEMRAVDAAAPESSEVLIARAGAAVARTAIRMLGGSYGRTVNIIAGKGNNGADGRAAGARLAARGIRVRVFDAEHCPVELPLADLVIDAAYGTGSRGTWQSPDVGGMSVLAVDLPSGVDALDGQISGGVLPAAATVTFGALKPGLLLPPASQLVGCVEVAEIGLGSAAAAAAHAWLVEASDVAEWLPRRAATAHKWRAAVRLLAGSAEMPGAAALAARGAMRAGAGIVQLSSPGTLVGDLPNEVVQHRLPVGGWGAQVLDNLDRFHALVIGPGLGRTDETAGQTRLVAVEAPVPTVIDGDGLFAAAWSREGAGALLRRRTTATVLTPHDGEYALLTGDTPGADRFCAARRLATDTGCVVLLKGAPTIVAEPTGSVFVVNTGDRRLATAGTGDVLAGVIGALLAAGVSAFRAAAAGAWLHGRAAGHALEYGMVAGDVADLLPRAWADALAGGA